MNMALMSIAKDLGSLRCALSNFSPPVKRKELSDFAESSVLNNLNCILTVLFTFVSYNTVRAGRSLDAEELLWYIR